MYNLHCHSLLSDGVLLPSEVAIRHLAAGYKIIAITDHADYSNIEIVARSILNFTKHWAKSSPPIEVLPGIELTHLPPKQFFPLVKFARKEGIKIIVGHGETLTEPVIKGTNRAALEAGVDILAHPGLISKEDILLAKKRKIFLEITSRKGHSISNSYVAEHALNLGANLILNTDAHAPIDIITPAELEEIGLKSGLSRINLTEIHKNITSFLKTL